MLIIDCKGCSLLEIIEKVERVVEELPKSFALQLSRGEVESFGYGTFVDIASTYLFRFLTPEVDEESVLLRFEALNSQNTFHSSSQSSEKYGVESDFFLIEKDRKFSFLYYYKEALKHAKVSERKRVLNLGINRGDEFETIQSLYPEAFEAIEFVGVDFSKSAIEYAKERFTDCSNCTFISEDINRLDSLNLGSFDLLISIGTLQSSTLNLKTTFMHLVQNYLAKDGAVILGFPNCRWIDGEMVYGARVPNYNYSELGTVIKDIYFCKKYLQQKRFRVTVTGKEYLFLTATSIV
jgi:SAM-dependent methyltransferase